MFIFITKEANGYEVKLARIPLWIPTIFGFVKVISGCFPRKVTTVAVEQIEFKK